MRTGVRIVLALFAADPPTARLLTVEVLALGRAGRERNDAAIAAFATRLGADWTLVAGMVDALLGKRVAAGEAATCWWSWRTSCWRCSADAPGERPA